MTWYWVSTNWATGGVEVDKDKFIMTTPPIWNKFLGQSFGNLIGWLQNNSRRLEISELNE